MSLAAEHQALILDGSKIAWHQDRLAAWRRGERFAPITIDMALTRQCQANCRFCYAVRQENDRQTITSEVMTRFLNDCAALGVRGVSFVSDGESTMSPAYVHSIELGHKLGISMANGTNGYLVTPDVAERVLPCLTYIRVNFNGGDHATNARIMGVSEAFSRRVIENVEAMTQIKERDRLPVTIGLQQVLMPQYGDQIIPLAKWAISLGVDYLVIKHCSDDEWGSLGVDYAAYERLYPVLQEAEAMSTPRTRIVVKWNKIRTGNRRTYSRCYGPPFILQISGSGLVAPCGMLFGSRYSKFHIGNIVDQSFREIVEGDRYWQVMGYLRSDRFDARRMCGSLCLQHYVNKALDDFKKGDTTTIEVHTGNPPPHINFI